MENWGGRGVATSGIEIEILAHFASFAHTSIRTINSEMKIQKTEVVRIL